MSQDVQPGADDYTRIDTSLVSPVYDLTKAPTPVVEFDTDYPYIDLGGGAFAIAYVDVSTDRGATWTTDFDMPTNSQLHTGHVIVPIPQAAGHSQAQVRFRYNLVYFDRTVSGTPGGFDGWQLDNVFVGNKTCRTLQGGLVAGHVTDHNTGARVNQAQVTVAGTTVTTSAAPDSTRLGDGSYYTFVPAGHQRVTASVGAYHPETTNINVTPNQVTTANIALTAGQLQTGPGPITLSGTAGQTRTATITVKNTGTRPATFSIQTQQEQGTTTAPPAPPPQATGTAPAPGTAWRHLAGLHQPITDSVAATDPDTGRVYSIGGQQFKLDGEDSYTSGIDSVYDPSKDAWTPIAPIKDIDPHVQTNLLSAGFIDGKLYVAAETPQPPIPNG